jgi:hypothetical protein
MTFTSTSGCHALVRRPIRPELFDIVEASDLRAENVDDHIARIDQHPIGMGQAFNAQIALPGLLQLYRQLVGNGADMAIGPAGGDDQPVGQSRLAIQVYGDNVLGLGVFKLGKDGFEESGFRLAFGRGGSFRGAFRRSAFLRL